MAPVLLPHNDKKGKKTNMATDKPRYTISVDDELFQKIEDFRFSHRYQTRSEATAELIRLGLQSLPESKEKSILLCSKPSAQNRRFSFAPCSFQTYHPLSDFVSSIILFFFSDCSSCKHIIVTRYKKRIEMFSILLFLYRICHYFTAIGLHQ